MSYFKSLLILFFFIPLCCFAQGTASSIPSKNPNDLEALIQKQREPYKADPAFEIFNALLRSAPCRSCEDSISIKVSFACRESSSIIQVPMRYKEVFVEVSDKAFKEFPRVLRTDEAGLLALTFVTRSKASAMNYKFTIGKFTKSVLGEDLGNAVIVPLEDCRAVKGQ